MNGTPYTSQEIALIEKLYPLAEWEEILQALPGRNMGSIHRKAAYLNVRRLNRPSVFKGGERANPGGEFRKGDTPFTKGKKQTEFMSAEGLEKVKKTYFQKGGIPHNTKTDNAITARLDKGTNKYYLFIRLAKNKWRPLHCWLWETKYGPIAENMVIAFKDGDTTNCNIENLEKISRNELMRRNSLSRYKETSPEIYGAIMAKTALKRTITQLNKRNGRER